MDSTQGMCQREKTRFSTELKTATAQLLLNRPGRAQNLRTNFGVRWLVEAAALLVRGRSSGPAMGIADARRLVAYKAHEIADGTSLV